jgi:hypothetical protein
MKLCDTASPAGGDFRQLDWATIYPAPKTLAPQAKPLLMPTSRNPHPQFWPRIALGATKRPTT